MQHVTSTLKGHITQCGSISGKYPPCTPPGQQHSEIGELLLSISTKQGLGRETPIVNGRAGCRGSERGRLLGLLFDFLDLTFSHTNHKPQERWGTLNAKDNYVVILHPWCHLGTKLSKYSKTFGLSQLEFSQKIMRAETYCFCKISSLIYL